MNYIPTNFDELDIEKSFYSKNKHLATPKLVIINETATMEIPITKKIFERLKNHGIHFKSLTIRTGWSTLMGSPRLEGFIVLSKSFFERAQAIIYPII